VNLRLFMSNETIFREVDEELRGDRLRAFWKRFGAYIIAAAVAVVLVVAVNEGWTWWQNSNAARSSDEFYAALELAEAGNVAEAQAALNNVAAGGSGGYPTLARFRQASLLAAEGNSQAAIAAYDALAMSETNPRLRDLALVLAAVLLVDSGDVAAVQQRVGAFAVDQHPMRNVARETIGLTQYKAGDLNGALATLEQIMLDGSAGQELQGRVDMFVRQLIALGATGAEDSPVEAETPSVGAPPALDMTQPGPAAEPATEAPATEPATEVPAAEAPPAETPVN
jgi:hypothetical protein